MRLVLNLRVHHFFLFSFATVFIFALVYVGAQTSPPSVWHSLQSIMKSASNPTSVDVNNNEIIDNADQATTAGSAATINGQQACIHGQGCNSGQHSCRLIYSGPFGQPFTSQTVSIPKPEQCGHVVSYGFWANGNTPLPPASGSTGGTSQRYGGCKLVVGLQNHADLAAIDLFNVEYSQIGAYGATGGVRWSALADHTPVSANPQRSTGSYILSVPGSTYVGNSIVRFAGSSVTDEIALYDAYGGSGIYSSLSTPPDWIDRWVVRDMNSSRNIQIFVC